jgi:hypothetical protein
MLLGASGQVAGQQVDLERITGKHTGDGGVAHGEVLVDFAEAVLGDDDERLVRSRGALAERIGAEALVDTAAVIAAFCTVDRVADATGIPLDPEMKESTASMRAALGIDDFESAK